jgi:hypothetical protein
MSSPLQGSKYRLDFKWYLTCVLAGIWQPRCCGSLFAYDGGDLWLSHPSKPVEPYHQQVWEWMRRALVTPLSQFLAVCSCGDYLIKANCTQWLLLWVTRSTFIFLVGIMPCLHPYFAHPFSSAILASTYKIFLYLLSFFLGYQITQIVTTFIPLKFLFVWTQSYWISSYIRNWAMQRILL